MKKNFELFIKGVIIGIGKIIPGVSGSVLAIMLGLYDKGIYAISHFKEDVKDNFLFLFKVGLGIAFSIILGSQAVLMLLEHCYFSTMLLFCGLVSGTIPIMKHKIRGHNWKGSRLTIVVFFSFTLLTTCMTHTVYSFSYSMESFLFLILVGFIEAATMIIPGISGTAILMMLGVYPLLLSVFGNVTNVSYLSYNLFILVPFMLGVCIGVLTITRLVDYSMRKYEEKSYYVIFGFSLSSVFLLFKEALAKPISLYDFLSGGLFFLMGLFFSSKFKHK